MAAVQLAHHDLRNAPRFALLIRTAKIVCEYGEFLCVVRDISASGVRLRLFHTLPPARRLSLELSNGVAYALERVWERQDEAGFRFAAEVDVHAFMEEPSKWPRRPVRLRLRLPIAVTAKGARSNAMLRDISRYGARIETAQTLGVDERLQLEIPGLPSIGGQVCWRTGPHHGLILRQTFTFEDLARIAAQLQPLPGGTGRPAPAPR